MRKTLKMTGIFSKWNVYFMNHQHENRDAIYISKDELHQGKGIMERENRRLM